MRSLRLTHLCDPGKAGQLVVNHRMDCAYPTAALNLSLVSSEIGMVVGDGLYAFRLRGRSFG